MPEKINLQVKLTGQYAKAFERFKDRPEMGGSRQNTIALKEIIRTLPEWDEVQQEA